MVLCVGFTIFCKSLPFLKTIFGVCKDNLVELKHKIFLNHSTVQKSFVVHLCADIMRCNQYLVFVMKRSSLLVGHWFSHLNIDAIK